LKEIPIVGNNNELSPSTKSGRQNTVRRRKKQIAFYFENTQTKPQN